MKKFFILVFCSSIQLTGQTYQIGNASNTATSGTIFQNSSSAKAQYIITASELTSAGMSAGYISSLSLEISNAKASTFQGVNISMANSKAYNGSHVSTIGSSFRGPTLYSSSFTTVFNDDVTFTSNFSGWWTFYFTNAFYWNGTSHIYVNFCFNGPAPSVSTPVTVKYSNLSANQSGWTTSGGCTHSSCSAFSWRPNFKLSKDKIYNGGSWVGGTPANGDHLVFNGTIGIFANIDPASITITEGNIVDVFPGVAVDVSGDVNVGANSQLIIWGDNSGYGQLKTSGSFQNSGSITCEQYIPSLGHHGIASPMTAGFTTTSGNSLKLYGYNASSGAWDMSPSTTAVGAGFFAPVQASNGFQSAAGTFSVTGTPNTSHTHSLGYAANTASGGSGNGWNLIGNPYTCGLDWSSVTKNNVNDAFYVWDPSTGSYQYYATSVLSGTYLAASNSLTSIIPPMQAFWVQSTTSGGSIVSTMSNDGTVTSVPTFYKTTPDNLILYAEDLSDQSLSDAMWITHASGYTNDFEGDQDAWKRSNYGGQANIYSYHNGEKMAINATDLSSSTSIPVGVKAPVAGKKYKLVLEQIVNNQDYQVIVEDKLYNSFTDVSNEGYVFTYGSWQNEDPRFVLHISQSTVGIEEDAASAVKAYQQGDRLILQGNAQEHGRYSIVTLDGRQVAEGLLQAGMAKIEAPMAGVYILQLSGASPVAQRIIVQ